MQQLKRLGPILLGPLLSLIIFLGVDTLELAQKQFLSVFVIVVVYWLFTNIPLYITGFMGVGAAIMLNLAPAATIFANFGHPIIFLFLAGFLLALAFQKVGLDRRISLYLLSRNFIKGSLSRLLLTLMALTAFFTMWISNTATTAMMLPLVLGVLHSLEIKSRKEVSLILISIAFASSIGGISTPIGSTPNIIALGLLQETIQLKISFLEWIVYAFPIALLFLGILILLTKFQLKKYPHSFDNQFLKDEYEKLSPLSLKEKYTLGIFLLTVFFWMLPSLLKLLAIKNTFNFNPGAVGVFFASFLFITPINKDKILIASDIKNIDWSSLMLFGSGLAFGKLLFDLGLAQLAGDFIIYLIAGLPLLAIFIIIFGFVIFSTELTSNTATANIIIPIMISLAGSLNISPFFFSMGVAMACSLAFMLPVATPPNAIVYGTEKVSKVDMAKLGFGLNLIFTLALALVVYSYQKILN
ncbi:MAG: hypothetical protein CME62_10415 [Halobacteriovoraceae bacterium]|nr:hypothetical protein [Halobacteriovoraceae bacterium]